MRGYRSTFFVLVAFSLASLPAVAQEAGTVEVTPYVALGSSAASPVGTQSRLAVTVNAGGGVKMPMNDKLDLRTDARWFKSFGTQGSEQFRVAQGISFDVGKRYTLGAQNHPPRDSEGLQREFNVKALDLLKMDDDVPQPSATDAPTGRCRTSVERLARIRCAWHSPRPWRPV
jgi:hypothetical protein